LRRKGEEGRVAEGSAPSRVQTGTWRPSQGKPPFTRWTGVLAFGAMPSGPSTLGYPGVFRGGRGDDPGACSPRSGDPLTGAGPWEGAMGGRSAHRTRIERFRAGGGGGPSVRAHENLPGIIASQYIPPQYWAASSSRGPGLPNKVQKDVPGSVLCSSGEGGGFDPTPTCIRSPQIGKYESWKRRAPLWCEKGS